MDWQTSPFFTAVVAAAASLITAVTAHVFNRSKTKADVHSSIATGAGLAVDTIADVLEQVRQELEEARLALEDARREIASLREDNASLRKSVAMLNVRLNGLDKQTEETNKP